MDEAHTTWMCLPVFFLPGRTAHSQAGTAYVDGPRPIALLSLPDKESFSEEASYHVPPSDGDVLIYSDGSKLDSGVGAAFVHLSNGSALHTSHYPLPSSYEVF